MFENVGDLVAVRDALEVDVDFLGAVLGDDVAALFAGHEFVVVAVVKVNRGGLAPERWRGLVLGGCGRRYLGNFGVSDPEDVREGLGGNVNDCAALSGLALEVHGGVRGVVTIVFPGLHSCIAVVLV